MHYNIILYCFIMLKFKSLNSEDNTYNNWPVVLSKHYNIIYNYVYIIILLCIIITNYTLILNYLFKEGLGTRRFSLLFNLYSSTHALEKENLRTVVHSSTGILRIVSPLLLLVVKESMHQ